MIYLIYVLLMMYSRKLIESGKLMPELGFWWIHGLVAVGVYILYKPFKAKQYQSNIGNGNGNGNGNGGSGLGSGSDSKGQAAHA